MIDYKNEYREFIIKKGVGKNDRVADSVKSYISYLNRISKYLNIIIEPKNLGTEQDIEIISSKLNGVVSNKTIQNYKSAMRQYINMVKELNL